MTYNLGDTVQLNTNQTARTVAQTADRFSEAQLAHAERLSEAPLRAGPVSAKVRGNERR